MNRYILDRFDFPNESLNFEANRFAINKKNALIHFFKNNQEMFVYTIQNMKILYENEKPVIGMDRLRLLHTLLEGARVEGDGHDPKDPITQTEVRRYNEMWSECKNIPSTLPMPSKIADQGKIIEVIYKDYMKNLERLWRIVDEKLEIAHSSKP